MAWLAAGSKSVIFTNDALLELVGLSSAEFAVGMRLGSLLNCENASRDGGCGTMESCRYCGAVAAMVQSLAGRKAVHECRIIQDTGEALDLRVWATPLTVEDQPYSVFALKDIGDEKRRRALERIFFHDILNTAGVLAAYADLLQETDHGDLDPHKQRFAGVTRRLVEEIKAQQDLLAAENEELATRPMLTDIGTIIAEVVETFLPMAEVHGKLLVSELPVENVSLVTDVTLLRRVLGNMVKNAIEACDTGDSVRIASEVCGDHVRFMVHNPGYMPRRVQMQLFKRSFSTKGSGRGLGTYSMKLLSEKYLHGSVDFVTSKEDGTTFSGAYPLVWPV